MRRAIDEENFIITIRNKNGDEVTIASPHEKFDMIISNSGYKRTLHNCLVTMTQANEYFDYPSSVSFGSMEKRWNLGLSPSTPTYSFDVYPDFHEDSFDTVNLTDKTSSDIETASEICSIGLSEKGSVVTCFMVLFKNIKFENDKVFTPNDKKYYKESFLGNVQVILNKEIKSSDEYSSFEKGEILMFRVISFSEDGLLVQIDFSKPCKKRNQTIDGYIGVDVNTFLGISAKDIILDWTNCTIIEEYDSNIIDKKFNSCETSSKNDSINFRCDWYDDVTTLLSENTVPEIDKEKVNEMMQSALEDDEVMSHTEFMDSYENIKLNSNIITDD